MCSITKLCNPVDCNPPGSSVHGISQARILEWVAMSSSGGSSQLKDQIPISYTGRQILYHWAIREVPWIIQVSAKCNHILERRERIRGYLTREKVGNVTKEARGYRDHKSRNAGCFQELEKARKQIIPKSLQKESILLTP